MRMQSAAFARLEHHLPNDNLVVLIELLRCYFGHNYPPFENWEDFTRPTVVIAKLRRVPQVSVGDINIYYEIHGSGAQTITLIRGLGADLCSWFLQVPELSKHFRTVVFDNRGSGRSDKPDAPYSIRQMASDVN